MCANDDSTHKSLSSAVVAPVFSVDILAASAASSAARWLVVRNGWELPVLSARLPALPSLALLPLDRAAGRGLV